MPAFAGGEHIFQRVAVLADGAQERVVFTNELERGVLRTMAETRWILTTGRAPRPRRS